MAFLLQDPLSLQLHLLFSSLALLLKWWHTADHVTDRKILQVWYLSFVYHVASFPEQVLHIKFAWGCGGHPFLLYTQNISVFNCLMLSLWREALAHCRTSELVTLSFNLLIILRRQQNWKLLNSLMPWICCPCFKRVLGMQIWLLLFHY